MAAAYERVDDEVLVNTETDGPQQYPAVALLADGGYVIVWVGSIDGIQSDVKGQLFSADGDKVGGEFVVNMITSGGQAHPSVAALDSGGFVVSWTDTSGETGDSSFAGIMAQAFDVSAVKVGEGFLVNTATTGYQVSSVVTGLAGGGFAISWMDLSSSGGDSSGSSIKARIYDSANTAIGGQFLVNSTTQFNQDWPSIVAMPAGGFAVAWSSHDGTSRYDIFIQQFDSAGSAIGVEQRASTEPATFHPPSIASLGSGFVVVWHGRVEDTGLNCIRFQLFDSSGDKAGEEVLVTSSVEVSGTNPHVQAIPGGRFIVTWEHPAEFGTEDIHAQVFDSAGNRVGDEFAVTAITTGSQAFPQALVLPSGDIVVVYADDSGVGGDASGSAVKLQRLTEAADFPFNNAPSLVFGPATVDEDASVGTVVGTASASDAESPASDLVFSLDDDSGGIFSIDSATGELTVLDDSGLDFESGATREITIRVTDPDGAYSTSSETIIINDVADPIVGTSGNDNLVGTSGGDRFEPLLGEDQVDGRGGSDRLVVDYSSARIDPYAGASIANEATVVASSGGGFRGKVTTVDGDNYVIFQDIENLDVKLDDFLNTFYLDGAALALGATIALDGGGQTDTLDADLSALDSVQLDVGLDGTIVASFGSIISFENFRLLLSDGADTATTGSGTDELLGGGGDDLLSGGPGNDRLEGAGGSDQLHGGDGADTIRGGDDQDLLHGGEDSDFLDGGTGIDQMHGNAGADTLVGGAGADTLNGGEGVDTASYETSDDAVDVSLARSGGQSGGHAAGDLLFEFENLTGSAFADLLIGDGGANELDGGKGNDRLDGAAGADIMYGGAGNDAFVVDDPNDLAIEASNGGTDTVTSSVDFTLSGHVERLNLAGSSDINGTGNTSANILTGNAGANRLDGGAGADTLSGGGGNDTYIVDHASDKVVEASEKGTDTVRSSIGYTLSEHVENLVLSGTSAINGTGNGLANTIVGNNSANQLNGAGGADILRGEGGDDIYIVDNPGDQVLEQANEGTDEVRSAIGFRLAEHVENLLLTGTAAISGTGNNAANRITGNSAANALSGGGGNDQLDGGAGADTMRGGAANDTYVVDQAGDQVVELADQGSDTVRSYISYTLGDHVENLALGGAGVINGTGNALANRLYGNAKANVLDGGAGSDTMQGRAGNDTYIVDNANEKIVELANEGTDTVRSFVTFTLASNVENLYLSGTRAINGTGNGSGNRLVGNSAANTLDGAGGADTMQGRAGNDIYFVDHRGDTVVELANEGVDRVRSSISFTLPQNFENLSLDGNAAISATGNTLVNQLVGNRGNNILDGGAGADAMQGRAGNDTYVVDNSGDTVSEVANEGTDRVKSSLSYTLGDHVENLSLAGTAAINGTGNSLANRIAGNKAANTLKGEGGNDTVAAGEGNDKLYGGVGKDVLEGGGGSDRFYFDTALGAANVDSILDFTRGADRVLLHGGIFGGLSPGALVSSAFTTGSAAKTADHRIIYNPATGALFYDADGAGGKAAVQFASLDNQPPALAASDFLVF